MKTAYITILTLTKDSLNKAVRCPVTIVGGKIDFRIPAQNDPYLICGIADFCTTEEGRVYGTEWLNEFGIYHVDLYQMMLARLTDVEFILDKNLAVALTGTFTNDSSLFRNADEDYVIYSTLYGEVPEPSNFQLQVRNSTSEWSTELDVWSSVNLKFRLINLENPVQVISQDFDFETDPNPFNGRLEQIQADGFQIFFDDSSLANLTVSAYNKDTGFTGTVLLRYIE